MRESGHSRDRRREKRSIALSDHFGYGRLLRFTFPSIMMMIFTSIYGMVDGFFISNFVGRVPFAAVNLIMPYLMIFGAFGMVLGSGGSALVSMLLGMGKKKQASETFSFLVTFTVLAGVGLMLLALVLLRPVALALGATAELLPECLIYGRICAVGTVAFALQNLFQAFLITAGRPNLGFGVTLAAGLTNMALDALFMGVLHLGVGGAAAATVIGQFLGGGIPLVFFLLPGRRSTIHLCRHHFDGRALVRSAANGSSEFLSDISMSVVNMLYNFQLMRFAGASGVAAYGVIMYANFIFVGVYFGYTMGAAPVIGYHYGAGNRAELHSLFTRSLVLIGAFALVLTGLAELFAGPLCAIFVGYDRDLLSMTREAFRIYSLSFVFMGFNIFGSGFFTALNNGRVSALIAFSRSLVFEVVAILLLPALFGIRGVWFSVLLAEGLSLLLTGACLVRGRARYGYA